MIASTGLVFDLTAESLLIGWLPKDYAAVAPAASLLTGGPGNGLYTVAGALLTLGCAVSWVKSSRAQIDELPLD